jgi:hypothetical protein
LADKEIRIYGHTKLFYWWPVWLTAFIFAAITYFDGQRLAIVPSSSEIERTEARDYNIRVKTNGKGSTELDHAYHRQEIKEDPFKVRMSPRHSIGAVFVIILLLVIVITNVPLRGLWSVIVIITLGLGTIIISLAGWWDAIFKALGDLHIHINLAGYLFIGVGLLVIWIFTMYFFDRQIYMVFTPGQLKVCLEIGGGETAYDTQGMVLQRQRDDMFRHWILGLGSGDLIVRTSGAHSHEFHMENVLNISSKLHAIEDMMRDKPIVTS